MKKTDLIIRLKWKAEINGDSMEGTEEEASWFYFDQRGTVFAGGPMKSPTKCNDDYDELIPLIKINGKFLSVKEIEERLSRGKRFASKLGWFNYHIFWTGFVVCKYVDTFDSDKKDEKYYRLKLIKTVYGHNDKSKIWIDDGENK
jgi:hypothetical protein